jgi:hypothetical protein
MCLTGNFFKDTGSLELFDMPLDGGEVTCFQTFLALID